MSDERPADKLLDHNYDGIRECNNNMPQWWIVLFYATIVFSVCYAAYRTFVTGVTAPEILRADLAAIEQRAAARNASGALAKAVEPGEEELLALLKNADAVRAGHQVYLARCAACHGRVGEGNIGPNLTDKYWLHGSKLPQIWHTISRGVLEKGMLAWNGVLKEEEISHVAAYVKSIGGSNPPNAKTPQGILEE